MKLLNFNLIFILVFILGCEKNKPDSIINSQEVSDSIIELSLKSALEDSLSHGNKLPKEIEVVNDKYSMKYFLDYDLENYIKKILKQWDPQNAAVAVIDNKSGGVIGAVGYYSEGKQFKRDIVFSNTHPAASIIKIITASTLVEDNRVSYRTPFHFNGKSTTLYKNQLKATVNKWSAKTDFSTAFSFSNNVVFGKAALLYSSAGKIIEMAKKFGFSNSLMKYFDLGVSEVFKPESKYGLAELATGFNKETMVSPVHAASISSVIARGGNFISPQVIKEIKKEKKIIWNSNSEKSKQIISKETSRQLSIMMRKVVKSGTARKMFRKYPTSTLKKLSIAGKTGSITGGEPYGKRDWFVSYGKKIKSNDPGISIAVMLVHGKDWKVRSTLIAKKIYEYYFSSKLK